MGSYVIMRKLPSTRSLMRKKSLNESAICAYYLKNI